MPKRIVVSLLGSTRHRAQLLHATNRISKWEERRGTQPIKIKWCKVCVCAAVKSSQDKSNVILLMLNAEIFPFVLIF